MDDIRESGPDAPYEPAETRQKNAEAARTDTVRRFIALATDRWKQSNDAEKSYRDEALVDDAFAALDQWDPAVKLLRSDPLAPKPCLTIDKLGQPIRQVINAQKKARFGIQVLPKGDGATKDDAAVRQGLIRHIERDSNAQQAYAWAFRDAVVSGRGWFRIVTEPASDTSFDFELKIRRVLNKYTVYPDPSHIEPDGSDMKWCLITEDLTAMEYRAQYPHSTLASLTEWESLGDQAPDWIKTDSVRVAEVWYTEPKTVTLLAINDGQQRNVLLQTTLAADVTKGALYDTGHGKFPILNRRDVDLRVVKWAKINAIEILEGNEDLTGGREWDGRWIPIVPVLGDEYYHERKRSYRGMIRPARDSQRLYNYQASALAERLATDTKVPWVGYAGQFSGHEAKWNTAHIKNWPYLEVNPITIDGKIAPLPQRNAIEPPIQALVVGIQQADADIKATTGFYEPSLGQFSKERSGRALEQLRAGSEMGSAHFQESLATAITHAGNILNDLLPKVYDQPGRVARILEGDDQERTVMLGVPFEVGPDGQPIPTDKPVDGQKVRHYRLDRGTFSVVVTVGRHFDTRRQEGAFVMGTIMEAAPQLTPLIADLWVGKQDFDGAPEIAERLKKTLPPELQDDKEGGEVIPPKVKMALDLLQQQHAQLTAIVNKLTTEREQKTLELESKERIAAMEQETKIILERARIELEKLKLGVQNAHEAAMAAADRQAEEVARFGEMAHERALAAQQAVLAQFQAPAAPPAGGQA